jgi:hypothetical protein
MVANANELAKELVNWELLLFHRYQVDAKHIKCPLEWWKKHETMFSIIDFLVKHILEIVNFQIETMNLFPLTKILSNLRKMSLTVKESWKFKFCEQELAKWCKGGLQGP